MQNQHSQLLASFETPAGNELMNAASDSKPDECVKDYGLVQAHIMRIYMNSLKRASVEFAFYRWKLIAWEMRAVLDYSWDDIVEQMKANRISAGWRKVRRGALQVHEFLVKELIRQNDELADTCSIGSINFKKYYKRNGDELRIKAPCAEYDIFFGLVYGYIAATELKGKQHLETASHKIKNHMHDVVLKIVE